MALAGQYKACVLAFQLREKRLDHIVPKHAEPRMKGATKAAAPATQGITRMLRPASVNFAVLNAHQEPAQQCTMLPTVIHAQMKPAHELTLSGMLPVSSLASAPAVICKGE